MKEFYVYLEDNTLNYSANQIFKTKDRIFLVESNKEVNKKDIIRISDNNYDINNNGYYVLIVINKNDNSITANYGRFSYCHSLYYVEYNNNFYIDLHLKNLVNKVDFKLELNNKSVRELVTHGFINSNETLIKQINKIPALKTLKYKNGIILCDSEYLSIEDKSVGNYVDNLKVNLPNEDTKIIISLSGGYDSTLLSYLLKDCKDMIAFTVGDNKDPTNEFRTAINTTKQLNIKHNLINSSKYWITYLPKIVELMEGEMFDTGVFLSYATLKEAQKLKLEDYTFVLGDGSDQLLNMNFYKNKVDGEITGHRWDMTYFRSYPTQILYYLILKKLEWLLRENDINYCLPYISFEFYDCAKDCKSIRKEEYKEFVREYIPKSISEHLDKKGGLIKEDLFVNNILKGKLTSIVNSEKYKEIFSNIPNYTLSTIIYKLYVLIFNYFYVERNSTNIAFSELINNLK